MGWRGFGFVHHSRTVFCAVPNPNITIRNFFIAVWSGGHLRAARARHRVLGLERDAAQRLRRRRQHGRLVPVQELRRGGAGQRVWG
jgi:hypothetical protein